METVDHFKALVDFERSLAVGLKVEARWTSNHREYRVAAEVVKVNGSSLRVKLLAPIYGIEYNRKEKRFYDGPVIYPIGHVIVLPRLMTKTHSNRNCAAPAKEASGS